MRILFGVHGYKPAYRVGGPIHSVPAVAERLVKRGHHVTIATSNWNLTEALDVPTDRAVDVAGVEVHYFPTANFAGHVHHAPRRNVHVYAPAMAAFLDGAIKGFDIAHTHLPFCYPTRAVGNAAVRAGVPLCYHQRGVFDPARLSHRAWKKRLYLELVEKPLCRRAACLFALTVAEVDSYRALGLTNAIEQVPNGVDLDVFGGVADMTQLPADITSDDEVILFVGRIHALKGVRQLVEAFIVLADTRPFARLIIAGPDEEGIIPELMAAAESAGLAARITFPGMVTGLVKRAWLARADIFVLPSNAEGLSMAILEALASGTPVIASPGCNFPELAAADAGLIVSPTPADLATALNRVLGDPSWRERMGSAGQRLVREQYGWDAIVDRFEAIYTRLASGRTTR